MATVEWPLSNGQRERRTVECRLITIQASVVILLALAGHPRLEWKYPQVQAWGSAEWNGT
jgi:hypothetical protein